MLERAIQLLRAFAPAGCSNVDCPSNVCQAARFIEEYDKSIKSQSETGTEKSK